MKALLIIIGLVILGGISFALLGGRETEMPSASNEVEMTKETQPETMAGESEVVTAENKETNLEPATTKRAFTIDAFNFGYSETELRVKVGDTVTINLTSSDGFHDWVVDEFGAATSKIQTGGNTSVTFVADKAGTFEYYCSIGSHRTHGMVGKLIVE